MSTTLSFASSARSRKSGREAAKYYGTFHVLSKDEAKFVFEKGIAEAEADFTKKGLQGFVATTPEAIHVFNKSHTKKAGLFHVT